MRAAFLKLCDKLPEGSYIFVAKKEILSADFSQIERDMRYALKKLKALS
jgi:ribonuclease P protein component